MKVFYHESDMDGWCSGAIIAKYTNNYNKEDYIPIDFNKHKISNYPLETIQKNEPVYISDLSFTEDTISVLDKLINICGENLYWNDHHKSSIELCNKFVYLKNIKGIRSSEKSGAYLTWKCFFPDALIPMAVKYVSDWDTFTHKFGDTTRYFKFGIDADISYRSPLSIQWKKLLSDYDTPYLCDIIKSGTIIDNYVKIDYKETLKSNVFETELDGYIIAVVNRSCSSLIFGDLYNKYPIVSTFSYDGDNWKYSLYSSDKNVDCEAIARKYGGGGHKGAAGFSTKELIYKKTGNIEFPNDIL